MKRAEWLKETRKMRFEEAYRGCQGAEPLTQEEATRLAFQPLCFGCFLLAHY